ncbi:MAG: acyl-CoA dehydrogenase family protein [Quisquiliibacterium sp.]
MTTESDIQTFLQRTERFARGVLAPQIPAWERERRIGREVFEQGADIGLTRVELPVEWGGLGLPFSAKVRMSEILAAVDFGFTMSVINTGNVANKLAREATPDVARRYVADIIHGRRFGSVALTEPGAGSDFSAITTTATRRADGWRIDGAKAWITNTAISDVIVMYAQTEAGSGARGIAGFLIDGQREGFIREPAFAMAGQHTLGTGGFRLDGYIARDDEMLQPPGKAFKAALASINGARTYIAAMSCGMVGEALRIASDYGERRHSFGVPLAEHQGWRWRLAEAGSELAACRMMVSHAAGLLDAGQDAMLIAAQAKLLATRMADRQLPLLMQAMGAEGLREEYPFGRHLIGARLANFVDGSTEMLLERISAVMRRG